MSEDYTKLAHAVKFEREYQTELCGILKLYLEKNQPVKVSYNCKYKRNCFQVDKAVPISELTSALVNDVGLKATFCEEKSQDVIFFKHNKHERIVSRMKSETSHPLSTWVISWFIK